MTAGFARMVERAGSAAELPFKPHPHMLRHAWGFALANKGRYGPRRPTWGTRISSIPSATRSWRPITSRTSGEAEAWASSTRRHLS